MSDTSLHNNRYGIPAILNPVFIGSGDVGGADADMIIDGCLFDIKTTIQPRIDPNWLRQIIGYVLLDYDDRYHINSVGIYMARQGMVLTWSLEDFFHLLSGEATLSLLQLRKEFGTLRQLKRSQSKDLGREQQVAKLFGGEQSPLARYIRNLKR